MITTLDKLFKIDYGLRDYENKTPLEGDDGETVLISSKGEDNGVCGFYDIEPTFKKLTITVGRIMCNPRVQLQDYATVPDDMYVLIPKNTLSLEFLFYVSSLIDRESWRFNYSRKVTKGKLDDISIPIPYKNDEIDNQFINVIARNSYGYNEISTL